MWALPESALVVALARLGMVKGWYYFQRRHIEEILVDNQKIHPRKDCHHQPATTPARKFENLNRLFLDFNDWALILPMPPQHIPDAT